jgi:hypothetical protein
MAVTAPTMNITPPSSIRKPDVMNGLLADDAENTLYLIIILNVQLLINLTAVDWL